MGTPFDTLGPRSWPGYTNVSAEARRNRALLAAAMRRRGLRPYDREWWHFTLRGEPFPVTYFDFPVGSDTRRLTSLPFQAVSKLGGHSEAIE